jgi:hypothetical protein
MASEGDLVLVHVEDKPAFFARIECISADVKPDWYQVGLLVLQVPPVQITWILKEEYINGVLFTMGGKRLLMEQVRVPATESPPDQQDGSDRDNKRHASVAGGPPGRGEKGKVVSLFDKK